VLRPLLEAEGYAVSEAAEPAAAERAWRQCAP
jgi:hypothetical protein